MQSDERSDQAAFFDKSNEGRRTKLEACWKCDSCERECVPIRSESRCLCGHRSKDHEPCQAHKAGACQRPGCSCPSFFFIVAEGSWVLKCSCKHRHTDHDPVTHRCNKKCGCLRFYSPWVCNCDHPWSGHRQLVRERLHYCVSDIVGLSPDAGSGSAAVCPHLAPDVNRWDLLQRGKADL